MFLGESILHLFNTFVCMICNVLSSPMGLHNHYFVTPPVPPIRMIATCGRTFVQVLIKTHLFFFFFLSHSSSAQRAISFDSLDKSMLEVPVLDSLIGSLESKYQSIAEYEIEQYTYIQKWKWLKYAPSFGWDLSLSRPIIGWNSTKLFDAINFNRNNRSKITSIIHRLKLDFQLEVITLSLNYDKFGVKAALYAQQLNIAELEKTYISIIQEQYESREITPSDHIKSSISYSNKLLDVLKLRYELIELRHEILIQCNYAQSIPVLNLSSYVKDSRH